MNRVMIQEGYSLPFDGTKKKAKGKHRRTTKAAKAAGAKLGRRMRVCAKKWWAKSDKFRKGHKWTAFMKKSC